jgi:hypothetical protein
LQLTRLGYVRFSRGWRRERISCVESFTSQPEMQMLSLSSKGCAELDALDVLANFEF